MENTKTQECSIQGQRKKGIRFQTPPGHFTQVPTLCNTLHDSTGIQTIDH